MNIASSTAPVVALGYVVKTWAEGIMDLNSLESKGAAQGRELFKPIILEATMF